MDEPREITSSYLNEFIEMIKTGSRVIYVMEKNFLAVEHPVHNYLILELKDKVVDAEPT